MLSNAQQSRNASRVGGVGAAAQAHERITSVDMRCDSTESVLEKGIKSLLNWSKLNGAPALLSLMLQLLLLLLKLDWLAQQVVVEHVDPYTCDKLHKEEHSTYKHKQLLCQSAVLVIS